jgi:hypothetical protein
MGLPTNTWRSIEDETGVTYVTTAPHFAWENGHAAIRTEDVDLTAAVIDGRLLKVVVADNDAVEAVGFVAMREKTALSLSADKTHMLKAVTDFVGTTELMAGDGALGDMTSTNFTYAATWTFASHTFTRTADAGNLDVVHDTAAVAGTMYQVNVTCTRSAGTLTPQVGGVDTTAITLSGSYTYYVVATGVTAPTLQASADFAGTVTNFSVYALDLTGYALAAADWALTCSADGATLTYTYTAGTNTDAVKITFDDLGGDSMTVGKLYKAIVFAGNAADDITTLGLYNVGNELIDTLTVPATDADIEFYFHYEAGMYMKSTTAADGDTLSIDITKWHNYEVIRMGTDALVIMNGDGEKYQWDSFGTDFDKNSDDYTFDIYEMRGGTAGECRMDTAPQTFSDQGLLSRSTSRDSAMEYPDHKDMEDFD